MVDVCVWYVDVPSSGVTFTQRVRTVLQWLKLPADKRPDFLTLYFDEPDHTGHQLGPDSPLVRLWAPGETVGSGGEPVAGWLCWHSD